MITGKQIIDEAIKLIGIPYVYGAEANDPNVTPKALDCSELVEYVCRKLAVKFVDGSENQFQLCKSKGLLITMDEAKKTPGALVFRYSPPRGRMEHVGISDGQGRTVEARGKAFGVDRFRWRGNWTHAALIPGVDYKEVIK